jgi:uncharacterized protein YndB with AHSA1/START domain
MELGTIERDIHVEASPEVVFAVISRPEHVREWWPDDARFEPVAGAEGELVWRHAETGERIAVAFAVVEVDPPRRFSFRWAHAGPGATGPSLLVTVDLSPAEGGTLVHLSETGFREMGWEAAVLEERYVEHGHGWDHFLPRLAAYAARQVTAS